MLVGARLFDTLRDARSPLPPVSAWESESAGLDVEGLRRLAVLVEAARGAVAIEIGGSRLTDALLLEPMIRGLVRRGVATLSRWGLVE